MHFTYVTRYHRDDRYRRMNRKRIARQYLVHGRVQGVSYRAFAAHAAEEAGVCGWVRNLADGDVEAQASGTAAQLDDFEARLRQGPRWADVRRVDVSEIAVFAAAGFAIR